MPVSDRSARVTSNVTINGDAYNDLIKVGSGSDTVNGGDGNDTAALNATRRTIRSSTMRRQRDRYRPCATTSWSRSSTSSSTIRRSTSRQRRPAPAAPPPAPVVSIDNVSMAEGNTHGDRDFPCDAHLAARAPSTSITRRRTAPRPWPTATMTRTPARWWFARAEDSKTIQWSSMATPRSRPTKPTTSTSRGRPTRHHLHAQGVGTIVNDDVAPVAARSRSTM